jgi:3-oxoadipate CoA-transferase beta subunit
MTSTRPNTAATGVSRDELAAVVARDISVGAFVNLGIGLPTKVSNLVLRSRWNRPPDVRRQCLTG